MALMRVLEVGIDGTDTEINNGEYGEVPPGSYVLVIGHEALSVIDAVGEGVQGFAPGDLVVSTVRRPDTCPNCQAGESDMCLFGKYTERGIKGAHGYMSDYYSDKPEFMVKIPTALRKFAVLLEPLSIVEKATGQAWKIQQRLLWQPTRAVVLGAGPIGILCAILLRLRGLEVHVYAKSAPDSLQGRILNELGASYRSVDDHPVMGIKDELGQIDFILEGTGNSTVAFQAIAQVGTNGVICLTGVSAGNRNVEIPADVINLQMVLGNRVAFGTVAGVNTRRYHGLLVAAMNPPVQRMVLLAALEEWLLPSAGEAVPLAAHEYWDGTVYPEGFVHLDGLELDGMLPVFRWTAAGRTIEKRIWMEHETNRSVISYRLVTGPAVTLQLRPLFAHRDYHQQRHGQGGFDMAETSDGWIIDAERVRSYLEVHPVPVIRSQPDWYWRVLHRAERARGLDDEEDLFTPGVIEVPLSPRAEVILVTGTEPVPPGWDAAGSLQAALEQQVVLEDPGADNPLAGQLVRAAEHFRVARGGCPPRDPDR